MLIGGDPLGQRHLWWNFVSSSRERIEQAREALNARARAGDRKAAGESDAMLWQLAACDEVLREAIGVLGRGLVGAIELHAGYGEWLHGEAVALIAEHLLHFVS